MKLTTTIKTDKTYRCILNTHGSYHIERDGVIVCNGPVEELGYSYRPETDDLAEDFETDAEKQLLRDRFLTLLRNLENNS